jgi:hypothetical protein
MGFLQNKAAVSGGGGGGYLNPSKIQSGSSVRFALMSDVPLEFYECWGEASDGSVRPFRFLDDPNPVQIEEEMGPNYQRRQNREGTGPEPVKFAIAVPVYNFESSTIQVMSLTQKSIIKEIDQVSQVEDYADLKAWDFILAKEGTGLNTDYKLRPVPRKPSTQSTIDSAWSECQEAGFDIHRLLDGGNPFKDA